MSAICLQENEVSRDIDISQELHRDFIGSHGNRIGEIRRDFNRVNVTLPNANTKGNVVTLRGHVNDVEKCYSYLQQLSQELVDIHTVSSVMFDCLYFIIWDIIEVGNDLILLSPLLCLAGVDSQAGRQVDGGRKGSCQQEPWRQICSVAN